MADALFDLLQLCHRNSFQDEIPVDYDHFSV